MSSSLRRKQPKKIRINDSPAIRMPTPFGCSKLRIGGCRPTYKRPPAIPMCPACSKSSDGDFAGLDELAVDEPRNTCHCGCPRCGALWMGHGHTPQIMLELTLAEAAAEFPSWQQSDSSR